MKLPSPWKSLDNDNFLSHQKSVKDISTEQEIILSQTVRINSLLYHFVMQKELRGFPNSHVSWVLTELHIFTDELHFPTATQGTCSVMVYRTLIIVGLSYQGTCQSFMHIYIYIYTPHKELMLTNEKFGDKNVTGCHVFLLRGIQFHTLCSKCSSMSDAILLECPSAAICHTTTNCNGTLVGRFNLCCHPTTNSLWCHGPT